MKRWRKYSRAEKLKMIKLYEAYENYMRASEEFGCAMSTIYYAVNSDAYEHHKRHVNEMHNVDKDLSCKR